MVYLEKVEVKEGDTFREVDTYIPLPLHWSNYPQLLFYPRINRQLDIHCDIGFILDPDGREGFKQDHIAPDGVTTDDLYLCFDTFVKPNSGSSLVPPGDYRLTLKVTTSNARPIVVTAGLQVPVKWTSIESDMYKALHPKITELREMK